MDERPGAAPGSPRAAAPDAAESSDDTAAASTCMFCGRPSGSGEYLWPEWLCRFFTERLRAGTQGGGPDDAVVERVRLEVDQAVDGICDACSHGWIRRLDDKVSPFLISMVAGEGARLPPPYQRLLARWAAKTAVVMDTAYDAPTRTPPSACEHLRRIGVHPGTQVLLGRYDGELQVLTSERDLFAQAGDDENHYLSQSTFVIGKVLIQVLADSTLESAPLVAPDATELLLPLVPSHDRKVSWPPRITVDDSLYDLVRRGPF